MSLEGFARGASKGLTRGVALGTSISRNRRYQEKHDYEMKELEKEEADDMQYQKVLSEIMQSAGPAQIPNPAGGAGAGGLQQPGGQTDISGQAQRTIAGLMEAASQPENARISDKLFGQINDITTGVAKSREIKDVMYQETSEKIVPMARQFQKAKAMMDGEGMATVGTQIFNAFPDGEEYEITWEPEKKDFTVVTKSGQAFRMSMDDLQTHIINGMKSPDALHKAWETTVNARIELAKKTAQEARKLKDDKSLASHKAGLGIGTGKSGSSSFIREVEFMMKPDPATGYKGMSKQDAAKFIKQSKTDKDGAAVKAATSVFDKQEEDNPRNMTMEQLIIHFKTFFESGRFPQHPNQPIDIGGYENENDIQKAFKNGKLNEDEAIRALMQIGRRNKQQRGMQ